MTILQSKLSGYYFKDFGVWTSDFVEARTFANTGHARDFVSRERLDDVKVIEPEVCAFGLLG